VTFKAGEGGVSPNQAADYYEILQISPNAEPETVHRVFRLLAQRFHPDNAETGNEAQFRMLNDAYRVLSDPEQRARYDVLHTKLRQERWRLVASGAEADNNFDAERSIRFTVLEVLYTRRRLEIESPGLSPLDLEKLTGRAREHLEFTIWYLVQKKYITRSDGSMLQITVDGVEYLESNYTANAQRRLGPGQAPKAPARAAS
jgi:curved DNA-binding protein CbpA